MFLLNRFFRDKNKTNEEKAQDVLNGKILFMTEDYVLSMQNMVNNLNYELNKQKTFLTKISSDLKKKEFSLTQLNKINKEINKEVTELVSKNKEMQENFFLEKNELKQKLEQTQELLSEKDSVYCKDIKDYEETVNYQNEKIQELAENITEQVKDFQLLKTNLENCIQEKEDIFKELQHTKVIVDKLQNFMKDLTTLTSN